MDKHAEASEALVKTVDWNIYYTVKSHPPHIENLMECVEAVLRVHGFDSQSDLIRREAAGDALNDVAKGRLVGYEVEFLNPHEAAKAVLDAFQTAPTPHS